MQRSLLKRTPSWKEKRNSPPSPHDSGTLLVENIAKGLRESPPDSPTNSYSEDLARRKTRLAKAFRRDEEQNKQLAAKLDLINKMGNLQAELNSLSSHASAKTLLGKLKKLIHEFDTVFHQPQLNLAAYESRYFAILDEHIKQAGYSRVLKKCHAALLPDADSHHKFPYRYSLKKDELEAHLKNLNHPILEQCVREEFFFEGAGGLQQVRRDYINAEHLCQGKRKLGFRNYQGLDDEIISQRLKLELREEDDYVIEAHSQYAEGFCAHLVSFGLEASEKADEEVAKFKVATPNYQSNLFKDPKTNQIYKRVFIEEYPIKNCDTSAWIGSIEGPLEALFKLVEKGEEWGFELVEIQTDNADLFEIMKGQRFDKASFLKKYVEKNDLTPQQWLERENSKFTELLKSCRGTDLYATGMNIKQRIDELAKESHDGAVRELAQHVAHYNRALQDPNPDTIYLLKKQGETLTLKPSPSWQWLGIATMTFATGWGITCGIMTAVSAAITATGLGAAIGIPGMVLFGAGGAIGAPLIHSKGKDLLHRGSEKNVDDVKTQTEAFTEQLYARMR